MLPPLIDISLFRDAIQRDCLILTPNQRLAAKIIQAWGEQMSASGSNSAVDSTAENNYGSVNHCHAWQLPRVYSVDHWLNACWNELQDQSHSLTEGLAVVGVQQSRYYWERAIGEDGAEQRGNFVKLASDTLKTLENWDLSLEQLPPVGEADNPSLATFVRWCGRFDELLRRNRLLTIQRSWQQVAKGFQCGALPAEQEIVLYGFQSIPPLQEKIIATASTRVSTLQPGSPSTQQSTSQNNSVMRIETQDSQQELRLAATWAAQRLKADPEQRIGIIVPELNSNLQQVTRVINEALAAEEIAIVANISAGSALRDTPIVSTALMMIGLLKDKRPLAEWLHLLYSPWSLFDQQPLAFRADSELRLRKRNRFDFTLSQFIAALMPTETADREFDETAEISALKPLIKLRDYERRQISSQQSFSAWADFIVQYLDDLGWPGKRTLNSLEYQQRQHWNRLLEQFCGLDNLGIEVGLTTALKHLQQLAQDSVFHPQTADAPLQILGLLEGSGLRFDQLWIVDMHNQNFPAAVAINQLLPAEFQRRHNMPHSQPQRELEIAQKLLQEYKNNCARLILSYPLMRGEEQLDPSPLIVDIPLGDFSALQSMLPHPPWLYQQHQCQLLEDQAPPYNPQNETVRGGSSLLKNQSVCPFNAFAIHRLKVEPLKEPTQGLSAQDRGSLLHEILFRLWSQWKSSVTLQALSDNQVQEQLATTIAATLTEWAPRHPVLRGDRFRGLEQQRLQKLIGQWLEEEKQRPPFEVVELESKHSVRFGDLEISLRLDRVDLSGDKLLIIDYKSGEVKASNWSGPRPVDPQLPLYVIASEPRANGCAFAQIKGGKIALIGSTDSQFLVNEKASTEPDPEAHWQQQIADWQVALDNLAAEFVSGAAAVEIHDSTNFGYQNHLLPLNRWPEEPDINAQLEQPSQSSNSL